MPQQSVTMTPDGMEEVGDSKEDDNLGNKPRN